jgi:hypothetical protein
MQDKSSEYRAYKLLQKIIVGCTAILVAVVFGMFLAAAGRSQDRCDDLQNLRAYVLASTNRTIRALPTISYYQEHPEERARALQNLEQQREEFATPLDCSLF